MANVVRIAKSASDWTQGELLAYNISVKHQSSYDFFGFEPDSALNQVDPQFLSNNLRLDSDNSEVSDETLRLLEYLNLATRVNVGQESAISDFVKEILRILGFEERGTLLRSRYAIPFTISGDSSRSAQTNVCLVHGSSSILFIVQEDKDTISGKDPEAQVIAEAIATFQYNNRARKQMGLDMLDEMVVPCIVMVGTRPIFYKVPVTMQLNDAVITAEYPSQATIVAKCVVNTNIRRLGEGMEVLEFRKAALQHLDAFKNLAKSYWQQYYV